MEKPHKTALFWFRRAVRLDDNRALRAAVDAASFVVPVFLLDDAILTHPSTGQARARRGKPAETLPQLCVLGRDYPPPVVDDAAQEQRALALYQRQEGTA